ncbi:MAG: hypothetical protein RL139_1543 [Gemmatimonadota bacterium]
MTREGSGRPRGIREALAELLQARGLDAEVARAGVLGAWARLVGPRIAAATEARLITADGTLVVGVRSHGWMQELSLMERQLLATLNAADPAHPVARIRWELLR